MAERWLVAMSGGVDSSVAAALMAREHDVVGVTMDLGGAPEPEAGAHLAAKKMCCGLPDANDARSVADQLGIRHYTANYRQEFSDAVIEPFLDEYARGRTPIPCVACNRVLKFDVLLRRADALGAEGVSTGHYARLAPGPDGELSLFRPRDREKDQTYFLFDLPRSVLPRLRFPLGELLKEEVRELATNLKLATADKPESQGICFIPDGDVKAALERLRPGIRGGAGSVLDPDGAVLGAHDGAIGYTLGQRKGLGLPDGPWYVRDTDLTRNEVKVDREGALWRRVVDVEALHWIEGQPPVGPVRVQVRHRHPSAAARIEAGSQDSREPADRVGQILFDEPVWAPAKGQAAVVYDATDERVLGGGWISGSR